MTRDMSRLEHRLAQAVCAVCDPIAVYLFGSRARGAAAPNSDADLLVIVDHCGFGLTEEIKDALSSLPMGVDIVLRTPDQLRAELANTAGFLASIKSGAIPLFFRDENASNTLLS